MESVILTNGHVLCMDADGGHGVPPHQYPSGYVAIEGGQITAVGPMSDAPKSAGEVIDCAGCAVLPGLINCHTHLPMVYFRGLADDLPLNQWLTEYIFPAEAKHLSPQFCYNATLLAAAECIRAGVTCVNDMYLFASEVAAALDDVGLRGLVGEGVIGFPTPSAPDWQAGLALSEKLAAEYCGHARIQPTLCAHAPYTCDIDLLSALHSRARELSCPFHIHLHESEDEGGRVNWLMPEESPTYGLYRIGVLSDATICAHCVWLKQNELRLLAKTGASVAHCPESNLKLASGIAPLMPMLTAGVDVGVGTDGAASNNNLDLLAEVRLAALLAKGSEDKERGMGRTAIAVPARTALELATRRAAAALKRDDIGVLAPGMRADIAVIDLSSTHLTPRYHHDDALYSHLVYAAHSNDVRDTIVEGKLLMRDRQLLTLDEPKLRADAQAWVDRNYPA
ncbi:MAG: amidohydrolase [bacterium]|nr:amidohydrolase [bacterium]